jgi:pectate lyase
MHRKTVVLGMALALGACTRAAAPQSIMPGTGGDGGAPVATGGVGSGGVAGTGPGASGGAAGGEGGGLAGVAGGGGGRTGAGGSGGSPSAGVGGGFAGNGGRSPGAGGAGGAAGRPASGGTGGTGSSLPPGPPETKPTGYGQATTGGGNAAAKTVGSMAELQTAIDAYGGSGGLVLTYTGKFDFTTISDPCTQWNLPAQIVEIKKKSDITLQGADGSAANFGIHIASSSANIIVRNMTFGLLPGGDAADAISIEGMSSGVPTDIWIDHNELFSSMADCPGAGDSSFDGLIDMKKGADRVTVSYNYLHDHHKVSLNGYTDSDDAVRHVTFHHNVFENVGSRTPLQRHGFSHIYNNLFSTITTSGINVRMDGYALVEANFFEHVVNPVTSRDSSALGFWELRANNIANPADFASYAISWSASTSTPTKDATDWTTTAAYPEALGYAYTAQPAACVGPSLKSVVGAGKHLATLTCP